MKVDSLAYNGNAMMSVKGKIKNGVVLPLEPVSETDEGRDVLILECQVDTGIPDLASQHDHYLYGTPKK
jgi:hypothetical protein